MTTELRDDEPEEPLIGLLDSVWTSVAELGAALTVADFDRPTDCPGWTIRDQVAHMLGTESMLAGRQAPASEVQVGELAHVRNPIGVANEQWVEAYRARSGQDTLAAFIDITNDRLQTLRGMSAAEWDEEGFTPEGPGPYRAFMEIRVFDCWFHEQDIREAVGRSGGLAGPVAELAVGRIPKALPYVVGKKAAAPDGSTVVFEVDETEYAVGVEGRAALLDAAPNDPTTRLRMDRRTFTRLAGGRWAGADVLARGAVTIGGDRALGEAVVHSLGYTI
jgi:uncharacterized protein (TIGR03083 family)